MNRSWCRAALRMLEEQEEASQSKPTDGLAKYYAVQIEKLEPKLQQAFVQLKRDEATNHFLRNINPKGIFDHQFCQ